MTMKHRLRRVLAVFLAATLALVLNELITPGLDEDAVAENGPAAGRRGLMGQGTDASSLQATSQLMGMIRTRPQNTKVDREAIRAKRKRMRTRNKIDDTRLQTKTVVPGRQQSEVFQAALKRRMDADFEMGGNYAGTNDSKNVVGGYDVDSALLAARAFHDQLLFFVYNSSTDDFVVLHNQPQCTKGCKRAYMVAPILARALRINFPKRFRGSESEDFLFLFSVGDMPRLRRPCLSEDSNYCKSEKWSPILQFGSKLSDSEITPTVIAMPQSPRPNLPCFDEFQMTGQVCSDLLPRRDRVNRQVGMDPNRTGAHFQQGLVFGDEMGLAGGSDEYWDKLIPQVVWRGTDFLFLHTLYPEMRAPTVASDVLPITQSVDGWDDLEDASKTRTLLAGLWEKRAEYTPRWLAVLLTSMAELDARESTKAGTLTMPWANMKFSASNADGVKKPAVGDPALVEFGRFGVSAIGDSMNMVEQASYKYLIDLGGGGGTTWTGTIEKLALPGLLFHHVTPTRDWIHDHLVPWEHYVPVRMDLSDLRKKFEWAESHPKEARRIAEAGTAFARQVGTAEGFKGLYREHVIGPLGSMIQAYRKPRPAHGNKRVMEIVRKSPQGENFGVVARCSGWMSEDACRFKKSASVPAEAIDIVAERRSI